MAKKKNTTDNRKQKKRKGADIEYGSFGFDEYKADAVDRRRDKFRRDRDRTSITPSNRTRLVVGFGFILLMMIALI